MDGTVATRSEFWQALFQVSQFTAVIGPVLLCAACLVWVWRSRSGPSTIAALGALMVLAGLGFHHLAGSMKMIGMPYPQPMLVSDGARFFLAFYAINGGYLALGVGSLWHVLRKK